MNGAGLARRKIVPAPGAVARPPLRTHDGNRAVVSGCGLSGASWKIRPLSQCGALTLPRRRRDQVVLARQRFLEPNHRLSRPTLEGELSAPRGVFRTSCA